MQRVAYPPAGRRRRLRRRRVRVLFGEPDEMIAHAARIVSRVRMGRGIARQFLAQRPAKRGLGMRLLHRAADPVDVRGRGAMRVLPHPGQKVGAGIEAGAMAENLPQAFRCRRAFGQGREALVGRTVAIADERERHVELRHRMAGKRKIAERLVVHDDEPREMQRAEFAERQERILRVRHPRRAWPIHRRKQRFERRHALRDHRRRDHEIGLGNHRGRAGRGAQHGANTRQWRIARSPVMPGLRWSARVKAISTQERVNRIRPLRGSAQV